MNFIKKYYRQKNNKKLNAIFLQQRTEICSALLKKSALESQELGVTNNNPMPIIISLTTFSQRINDVYLTIESLLQQSHKPSKIWLWVCEKDISEADIPAILKLQSMRGLEIKFCSEDLGPYTKYFYTLLEAPEALIITVDDDIMYPVDLVDQLYRAYLKEPTIIHCHRAHQMLFSNNKILPYEEWRHDIDSSTESLTIFPTGVGGVLYFPGCFDSRVLDDKLFKRLSPNADDVWLKAMSLMKQVKCKKVPDNRDFRQQFLVIPNSQKVSLKRQNKNKKTGNSSKIQAVFDQFKLNEYFNEQ